MRVGAVLLSICALASACSAPHGAKQAGAVDSAAASSADSRYTSATISRSADSQGRATNDKRTLSRPEDLNQLMSYFPEAGQARRGPQAGGWNPAVIVRVKPKLGRQIVIKTNYEVWSEGTGDWPIKAGFRDYIDRLFAGQ